jgi:AAT family amino acid transporter
LKFRKAHPQGGDFKAPWHPFGDYYVLAFLAMVVIVMLFSRETAIAEGLAVIWIGSLYFTRKHRHQKSRK